MLLGLTSGLLVIDQVGWTAMPRLARLYLCWFDYGFKTQIELGGLTSLITIERQPRFWVMVQ